jgi:chromosome segregation ATPase
MGSVIAAAKQANTDRDEKIEALKQELTENTRYYAARLNEAGATIATFKDKLEAAKAKNQRLKNDSGNLQAEVAEQRSQLETERADRIMQLKAQGWGKAKIILEIWGVTKGGSPKYKAAEAEYQRLVEEGGE